MARKLVYDPPWNKDDFVKLCIQRGYSDLVIARKYVKQNPKAMYDEEDAIAVYDMAERCWQQANREMFNQHFDMNGQGWEW